MSARFFFDLVNGHDAIRDDDGVKADDADQAIAQAVAVVEEYRASGELHDAGPDWEIVVRDAQGTEIKRISL